MRRKLLNFAAMVSLVLFLATVVLWITSYWKSVGIARTSGRWGCWVWVESNRPVEYNPSFNSRPPRWTVSYGHKRTSFDWQWRTGGFVIHNVVPPELNVRERTVAIPFWFLAGATFLPMKRALRRQRQRSGHCLSCHYDLTGNTSGTCPECGTPIAGEAEAKA